MQHFSLLVFLDGSRQEFTLLKTFGIFSEKQLIFFGRLYGENAFGICRNVFGICRWFSPRIHFLWKLCLHIFFACRTNNKLDISILQVDNHHCHHNHHIVIFILMYVDIITITIIMIVVVQLLQNAKTIFLNLLQALDCSAALIDHHHTQASASSFSFSTLSLLPESSSSYYDS